MCNAIQSPKKIYKIPLITSSKTSYLFMRFTELLLYLMIPPLCVPISSRALASPEDRKDSFQVIDKETVDEAVLPLVKPTLHFRLKMTHGSLDGYPTTHTAFLREHAFCRFYKPCTLYRPN